MAALAQAEAKETPALGVFYEEKRPTLADAMAETIRRSGGQAA